MTGCPPGEGGDDHVGPLGDVAATLVMAGNRADDPLYVSLIEQTQEVMGQGKLYVGERKMVAVATRVFIHHRGDVYLCPSLPHGGIGGDSGSVCGRGL